MKSPGDRSRATSQNITYIKHFSDNKHYPTKYSYTDTQNVVSCQEPYHMKWFHRHFSQITKANNHTENIMQYTLTNLIMLGKPSYLPDLAYDPKVKIEIKQLILNLCV